MPLLFDGRLARVDVAVVGGGRDGLGGGGDGLGGGVATDVTLLPRRKKYITIIKSPILTQ